MSQVKPKTVQEQIFWSYANLARADAALQDGVTRYRQIHHIIRSRLYKGLCTGSMSISSLYQDERLKMTAAQACYYCGSRDHMVVDHLIPRMKGGPDEADNLVWACRSCNSSKRDRDLLEWTAKQGIFPPLLLLRRYTKIIARYCEEHGQMARALEELGGVDVPFDVRQLPTAFPPLDELTRWVLPKDEE